MAPYLYRFLPDIPCFICGKCEHSSYCEYKISLVLARLNGDSLTVNYFVYFPVWCFPVYPYGPFNLCILIVRWPGFRLLQEEEMPIC